MISKQLQTAIMMLRDMWANLKWHLLLVLLLVACDTEQPVEIIEDIKHPNHGYSAVIALSDGPHLSEERMLIYIENQDRTGLADLRLSKPVAIVHGRKCIEVVWRNERDLLIRHDNEEIQVWTTRFFLSDEVEDSIVFEAVFSVSVLSEPRSRDCIGMYGIE